MKPTSSAVIEAKAPGKLYIAGEYAVVEPGEPSVIVAVDRVLTVQLTKSDDEGRVFSSEYGRMPVVWTRDDDKFSIRLEHQPFDYVMAAIALTERLRSERGHEPLYFDLHIESELDDSSGRKFGLGSSAAVVVATIAAINEFYGLGLTSTDRFKLALLSTAGVSPRSSGGDLAASTFGGWIRYTSPNRDTLLRDLERNDTVSESLNSSGWDTFSVTQLPEPKTLNLLVGWTGSPASTERLVSGVEKKTPGSSTSHEDFLADSRVIVDALVTAMQQHDTPRTLELVRSARALLQRLGTTTGIQIETEKLRALCEIAEAHGAAAKPSGAGGGDCGIVFAGPDSDNDAIYREWEAAGISRLGLGVTSHREALMSNEDALSTTDALSITDALSSTDAHRQAVASASKRKEDHIRLAADQGRERSGSNDFDDLEFVHHALDGIDVAAVDLATKVGDWAWPVPLYINGMTGGADTAMRVNRSLAIAARETGLPMASGSVGIAIDDASTAGSFRVIREENPDGFVMANVGAGRPAEHGQRAVDLLDANALQLHLNAVQETVMPEGGREFSDWLRGVERTVAATSVPVIVKEVGFGLSRRTLQQLREVGVQIADVSGSGGTNFARIESARGGDAFSYLGSFGQSAAACLLDAPANFPNLLASGGVRHPLDVVKALALGARAVGVAGPFLLQALEGTPETLTAQIRGWIDQVRMLHAMLGAATPADLSTTDLLVRGRVREFATLRAIDISALARRTDARGTLTQEER